MRRARLLWLTLHRWLGLGLGLWFVLLGLSGSALVFYTDLEPWFDARLAPVPSAQPVSIEAVVQALQAAHPQRTAGWRIELPAPGQALVTARYLRPAETAGRFFAPLLATVDGRRGALVAERYWGATPMTWLYDLHYTLLLGDAGRQAVAVAGLLLVLSMLSGLWLWWPRTGHWREALRFKRAASPQRRVYDLHKVAGIAMLPVLLVLGFTGAVLGWPAVSEPVIGWFSPLGAMPRPVSSSEAALPRLSADAVLARLQRAWPDAQPRWIDVPGRDPRAPYRVRLRFPGDPGDRFPSSVAWFDARTGAVLALRGPQQATAGDTFRQWMHPLHGGEGFGLAGRIVVCVGGLGPLALALTGWWRWRHKRRAAARRRDLAA
jgi:uncharacterized iron-regulated membrane protein